MNLRLSGRHLDITPSLRAYVETKLARVIRHFDHVMDANILLAIDNQKEKDRRQHAEINLRLKGKDVFIESHHEDLYAAIDLLIDKLDRQILKHKHRTQERERDARRRQAPPLMQAMP